VNIICVKYVKCEIDKKRQSYLQFVIQQKGDSENKFSGGFEIC